MSMSPKKRTRLATARPDSCRKTRSISRRVRHGPAQPAAPRLRSASASSWNGRTSTGTLAGGGRLGRPRERGVEVGGLDDPEAADLLLGLGERAVGGEDLAVLARGRRSPCRACGARRRTPSALGLQLLVEGVDVLEHLLHGLGRPGPARPRRSARTSRYCFISSRSLRSAPAAAGFSPPTRTPGRRDRQVYRVFLRPASFAASTPGGALCQKRAHHRRSAAAAGAASG